MLYLQNQQLDVIKSFVNHARSLLDPKDQPGMSPAASPTSLNFPGSPTSAASNRPVIDRELELRKKNFAWFTRMSDALVDSVKARIEELETLKQSAESVSGSVSLHYTLFRPPISSYLMNDALIQLKIYQLESLLALKQQQASVVQAWQSVQQAEEAVRQGRAIMVFTLITIIFVSPITCRRPCPRSHTALIPDGRLASSRVHVKHIRYEQQRNFWARGANVSAAAVQIDV